MRTATTVELSGACDDVVQLVVEGERLGLDICWVAEAWGSDAPSALGYLAARTERMLLGSGILQVGVRSPVMVAHRAGMPCRCGCRRGRSTPLEFTWPRCHRPRCG